MPTTRKRRSFEPGHSRKFLLIVDDSQEVESALYYAASRVLHSSGSILMLYVIEPQQYQHWAGVRQVQIEEETAKAKADAARPDAIAGINGVKHQTSAITEGSSVTKVEFRLEIEQDRAVNDVKDAIARIRAELPRTIDEPIVTRIQVEGLPIVTYAARAPGMTPEQLSWFVDDTVARALQGVKGVSQIERIGGVDREIRVALDPDRLLAYGTGASNQAFGLIVKHPSGQLVLQGYSSGNDLVSSTPGTGAGWLVQSGLLAGGAGRLFRDGVEVGQLPHTYNTVLTKLVIGAEIHLPFGGTKHTGNGYREAGTRGLEQFSETKSVYIDYSGKLQKAQIDNREAIA